MKKIILVLLLSLLIWGGFTYRQNELKKKIVANFEATVIPIYTKMLSYKQLSFIAPNPLEVDFETKKEPEKFIQELKGKFTQEVISYNQSQPWGLPFEIDVTSTLQSMSLDQKVAQLFIFGFDRTIVSPGEISFLKTYQPGGIIVMGKNVSPSLKLTLEDMQATQNTIPLFVGVDQEGGTVKRIKENLPGQQGIQLADVCDVYTKRGSLLSSLGINMNFGIVADITKDTQSFIYPRVFLDRPSEKVFEAVSCTTHTLSTLKHFPGHGGTSNDTHLGIARVNKKKTEREEADLKPFEGGIKAGADLIMMGHLLVDFLDPIYPATLSLSTNSYLREIGFDGLIITDDMQMISSNGDQMKQLEEAIVAGNDLLLYVNPENKENIMKHAIQFIASGGISIQDLNQRVERILLKKQKIISRDDFVPLDLVSLEGGDDG